MVDLADLMSIAVAFFIVTVSPGPANLAVATVSMSTGRRDGLMIGAGLSVGLAFWGVVAATGFGAVLQNSANLLMAIKIIGGLYLLWLAVQSGRSAMTPTPAKPQVTRKGRWFWRGLILNLSNPKAVVAWMAALSMGLGAGDGSNQVIVATAMCAMLGVVNYSAYALLLSVPQAMATYRRARRWIEAVAAGLFAIAGLGLIRSAFSR